MITPPVAPGSGPRGPEPAAQRTFEHYRAELDMRLTALKLLDDELVAIAHRPPFADTVTRLCALRGIAELSALTIAAEVGDFTRQDVDCISKTGDLGFKTEAENKKYA